MTFLSRPVLFLSHVLAAQGAFSRRSQGCYGEVGGRMAQGKNGQHLILPCTLRLVPLASPKPFRGEGWWALFLIACVSLMLAGIAKADVSDQNAKLIQAAANGNLTDVDIALTNGADINAKDTTNSGVTALYLASQNGHTDVVRLLLEKGADVDVKRITNVATALEGNNGTGPTDSVSTLHLLKLLDDIKVGNTKAIEYLIEKGEDVNIKNPTDGVTALWIASQNGYSEIVRLLLEKGAKVNIKTNDGTTALMIAAKNDHTNVIKLLVEKGADVNVKSAALDVKTTNGSTAIMPAAQNGHTEIVKLLCEWGADVNIKAMVDNVEYTALTVAKKLGQKDIVGILESIGAKE